MRDIIFFFLPSFLKKEKKKCIKSETIHEKIKLNSRGVRLPQMEPTEWPPAEVMECFLNENTPVFRTNMCH